MEDSEITNDELIQLIYILFIVIPIIHTFLVTFLEVDPALLLINFFLDRIDSFWTSGDRPIERPLLKKNLYSNYYGVFSTRKYPSFVFKISFEKNSKLKRKEVIKFTNSTVSNHDLNIKLHFITL